MCLSRSLNPNNDINATFASHLYLYYFNLCGPNTSKRLYLIINSVCIYLS